MKTPRPRCKIMPDCTIHPNIPHDHVNFTPRRDAPQESGVRRQFQLLDFGRSAAVATETTKRLIQEGLLENYLKRSFRLSPLGEASQEKIARIIARARAQEAADEHSRWGGGREEAEKAWAAGHRPPSMCGACPSLDQPCLSCWSRAGRDPDTYELHFSPDAQAWDEAQARRQEQEREQAEHQETPQE